MTKLSNLTKVTTVGDDALFYIVDPARSAGDRSVGMDKDDVKTLVGGGGGEVVSKTGTTIEFTEDALYNEQSFLTSGNLTLDLTNALKGAFVSVYCNGYDPLITGEDYFITSGSADLNALNILSFYYDGTRIFLNYGNVGNLSASTLSGELGDEQNTLNWTAVNDADNYVLERSLDNFVTPGVQIYSGNLLTFTDTGLTNGTAYNYRVKAQGNGFIESVYSNTITLTPELANPFLTDLSASWAFENNLNDFTGNNNITDASAQNYVAGQVGNAVNTSTSAGNTFRRVTYTSDFDYTAGGSWSFWLNTIVTDTSLQEVFMQSNGFRIIMAANINCNLTGATGGLNQISIDKPTYLPQDTWKHFVLTFDPSQASDKMLKWYVDGVLVSDTSNVTGGWTSLRNDEGNFGLGNLDSGSVVNNFDGYIDEFHTWKNRVLTAAEALDIYNTENAGNSIFS